MTDGKFYILPSGLRNQYQRWIKRESLSVLQQELLSYYYLLEEPERLLFLVLLHAQSATLGEPFFVEKGKNTVQKEIGPNRTQYTFTSNGTMNGNIEVTDTGEYVSVSKGNNLVFDKGQGVIKTKDGSETANYTS